MREGGALRTCALCSAKENLFDTVVGGGAAVVNEGVSDELTEAVSDELTEAVSDELTKDVSDELTEGNCDCCCFFFFDFSLTFLFKASFNERNPDITSGLIKNFSFFNLKDNCSFNSFNSSSSISQLKISNGFSVSNNDVVVLTDIFLID